MDGFFATNESVKEFGNMPSLDVAKITPFFNGARRDVMDVITKEVYDDIVGYDEDAVEYLDLKEAESYMLLKKLVPVVNISSEGDGITKATGTGDNRQENLSEMDLDRIIERYDGWAMAILKRYIPAADVDEDCSNDSVVTSSVTMIAI